MKQKIILILLLVLLISNVVLLYLFLNKEQKGNGGKQRMLDKLKTEVGFSNEQVKQFETLREQQKEANKPLMDSMVTLKKAYIGAIFAKESMDSISTKYVQPIAKKMLAIDMAMYGQLMEARKICTPNQYTAYDSIVKKMMIRVPDRKEKKQ